MPHIGIALNELVSVSESQPTYLEGEMINFCKMRRVSRGGSERETERDKEGEEWDNWTFKE